MPRSWRRWLPGPKHGIARAVAVYGPSGGDNSTQISDLLSQCHALRAWAAERGIVLNDDPDSLAALDGELAAQSGDPRVVARLSHEVGCYLGTVIVKHVSGTSWRAWPNGHPVVRLRSGREVDVIAKAHHALSSGDGSLMSIFIDAE